MITVYTQPDCIQCDRTTKALTRAGVDYTTRDVTADPAAYRHVTETLGYVQAPVVVTDTGNWSGYNPDKLKALTATAHRPDAATLTAANAATSTSACR